MTAPARSGTRTPPPPVRERRERTATQPERSTPTRGRSAAAERAYARRAQRAERERSTVPTGKAERKPGSAGRATFVILVMALLVGGVVATLWFSTQATADAYKLEQAKKDTQGLSVRVAQLRRQVAQQDSAPALGNRAQQLGMVPAGDPAHLVVGPDGSVIVIGTPSAAHAPTTTPPPPATTTTNPPATTTTNPGTTTTTQTPGG